MLQSSNYAEDAAASLKHPESLDDFILFRLNNLSKMAVHGVSLMLHREVGINQRDARVLAHLSVHPGQSLTQLARLAELNPVVASRSVANLVARGLILKTRQPSNKRRVVLALTDAGRVTCEQVRLCGRKCNADLQPT